MEAEHVPEYFVLPLWSFYTSTVKCSTTNYGDEKLNENTGSKTNKEPVDQEDQAFLKELEKLKRQEKEANDAAETLRKTFAQNTKDLLLQAGAARASSTNYVNTASTLVNTVSTPVNTASTPIKTASLARNVNAAGPSSPDLLTYTNQDEDQIPSLEDIYAVLNDGIFTSASYDAEGAVADFTNLESSVNIEPKKISQALKDESWVDAMHEYLLQFKTQQVWILVDLPFGETGHRQEERVDYDEVFAPVARLEAIRIFLAFASYMGFIVYQMDVKSAFLYVKIDEEVNRSGEDGPAALTFLERLAVLIGVLAVLTGVLTVLTSVLAVLT
nr:putative ribonuclease H-like domain-containing protein [Tanacetum cinerariifolium]